MADGLPLSERLGDPLPYLVKLIDTARPLSIQLHPADDPVARTVGKEEAWIVLEAEPGATVLAGLEPGMTRQRLAELTEAAFADPHGAGPSLVAALEPIEVVPGSVIFIAARTLHAIQGGILLAEIQQPSDCTYRLFDYGSERETHVEQVLEHIEPAARAPAWQPSGGHAVLEGAHLRLEVHEGEQSLAFEARGAGPPQLLVPARGLCKLTSRDGDHHEALEPGELRLHYGGAIEVDLGPGAQLVVGGLRTADEA